MFHRVGCDGSQADYAASLGYPKSPMKPRAASKDYHNCQGSVTASENLLGSWKAMLLYSPFAFASARLESQYNAFLAQKVRPRARTLLVMTTLFWVIGIMQAFFSVLEPVPFLFALCTLCVSAGALYIQTAHQMIYTASWPAVHFLVHMMHVITHMTVRTAPIKAYRLAGDTPCVTSFSCIHELLLIFPHLGAGLVASTGIVLPFLLQIVVQASIFFGSMPGNIWLCEATHGLSQMVERIHVPGLYNFVQQAVSRGVVLTAPQSTVPGCGTRLAFWGIQVGVVCVIITLLGDMLSRRQFLAKHPELIGPGGPSAQLSGPLGRSAPPTT
eukprot:jgi/Botrbrau1/10052/Bobra.0355s0008.1